MINRYSRNIRVIGADGQKSLGAGSVFVIGCGALGGNVIMTLAGAGIGRIGIADFDTIDVTNLQRQLFFSEHEAGKFKSDIIANRAKSLNSEVKIDEYRILLNKDNAPEILRNYDFIIDATDNPDTKYLTEQICGEIGKPACIGGVEGWRGQVMTIVPVSRGAQDNATSENITPESEIASEFLGAKFSDFFPRPDSDTSMLPCESVGVLAPIASLIAAVQASEAIKFLSGKGDMLTGRLFVADIKKMIFTTLTF